jgi:hypothetical protein
MKGGASGESAELDPLIAMILAIASGLMTCEENAPR